MADQPDQQDPPPQRHLKRGQVPPAYMQQQGAPPPPQGPDPSQQPQWGPPTPPQGSPPGPPRKKRTGLKVTLAIVGAVIVLIIIGSALGSGGGNAGSSTVGATSPVTQAATSPAASPTAAPPAAAPQIGDKVRDGKFQFVVTKVSHAKSVGDTSLGLGDTAQGEYLIVSLKVTNIGNESQTLDDSAQFVYDARGRKYSASSAADIDLSGPNGSGNTWFEDINPGNTVRGKIAFDMPKGDKGVKIELHDSLFSGGVTVLLK